MFDNLRNYLKKFLSKPHVDARAIAGGIAYAYRFQGKIGNSVVTTPLLMEFEIDLN